MANMADVKRFFEEGPNGRKCTVREMKALAPEDLKELKELVAQEG